tara:strand:+ start:16202 stop:17758 length:1557 start_codon:yes stop_codon:yes gene_type:complete
MAAIITDQLRILNAKNFVSGVQTSTNSYYTFIGLPNPTDYLSTWNNDPPSPKDSLDQSNDYYDTMIALKKISSTDVTQVVKKNTWRSGNLYDMWRNDITRSNPSQPSGSFNIYSANYYVINSDFRVYSCLNNNALPENDFKGSPSLDEPLFTDLEPRAAGSSGDGYVWKYLYTIKPSDAIKFDSTNYIPVPNDWGNTNDTSVMKQNASSSGQLKICTIRNRGAGLGNANTYTNVPIKGDGRGAKATIVVNADSKIESISITNGGSNYTYGTVDYVEGGIPIGATAPLFDVIIPPSNGYGFDIYSELGAFNVLTYSRFENDTENPDFITGNEFARVGLIENPQQYGSSSLLTSDKASATYALKLIGIGYSSATFTADTEITQKVGVGSTAVGRVVSYDQTTGVLKYWQDRTNVGFNSDGTTNSSPKYGFECLKFDGNAKAFDGNVDILGGSATLQIGTSFSGITTIINNRTYNLGQEFVLGVAQPESKQYSGNIVYVDNRPSITRSSSQKEDVKIILQF